LNKTDEIPRPSPPVLQLFAVTPHSQTKMITSNFAQGGVSNVATLVHLLRWRAETRPNDQAYLFLDSEGFESDRLTYGALDRRACAIACTLQSMGVSGSEPVLLLYPPGLDYVAGFFGCLYAGAIAVPAYPPNGRNITRLESIMRDAAPRVALTVRSMVSRFEKHRTGGREIEPIQCVCTEGLCENQAWHWREPQLDGKSLALLQYTSGSTGSPRGVMVTHGNLMYNQRLIQKAFQQTEESIILSWLPLYHDMGLIGGMIQPMYAGATCVLMSPLSFLQRPVQWLRAISAYRATTSGGPNFAYDLCVRKISEMEKSGLDLSTWTAAFNGAETVRADTLDRFAKAFASCRFRSESFYPCYGLAEATLLVTGGVLEESPQVLAVATSDLARHRRELQAMARLAVRL